MTGAIINIGQSVLNITKSLRDTMSFAVIVILKMFDRKAYNTAVKMVLIDQIYFTSVQILPLFLFVSIIFGSLLILLAMQIIKELGHSDYLGRLFMGFVVTELSPFITVLLIALRSSSAINTEIAVMKVNKELRTLEAFNIDATIYLFLPRIINGIISVVLLSGLFSIVALASGLFFSNLMLGMSLETYANVLLNSAHFSDIIIMLLKCSTFGFFITLLPILFGLRASNELTSIPIVVLNGMVKVFIAIIIIEVLSLIIRFI